MLTCTRAYVAVMTLGFAVSLSGTAHAALVEFEFTGIITDGGHLSGTGIAETGDPFRARLLYDTDQPVVVEFGPAKGYMDYALILAVRETAWLKPDSPLFVIPDGTVFGTSGTAPGVVQFGLLGTNVIPPGDGLPTSINLANADIKQVAVYGPEGALPMIGEILAFRQILPEEDPVTVVPEPATLTLSALGLVTLVARRRRVRG